MREVFLWRHTAHPYHEIILFVYCCLFFEKIPIATYHCLIDRNSLYSFFVEDSVILSVSRDLTDHHNQSLEVATENRLSSPNVEQQHHHQPDSSSAKVTPRIVQVQSLDLGSDSSEEHQHQHNSDDDHHHPHRRTKHHSNQDHGEDDPTSEGQVDLAIQFQNHEYTTAESDRKALHGTMVEDYKESVRLPQQSHDDNYEDDISNIHDDLSEYDLSVTLSGGELQT